MNRKARKRKKGCKRTHSKRITMTREERRAWRAMMKARARTMRTRGGGSGQKS